MRYAVRLLIAPVGTPADAHPDLWRSAFSTTSADVDVTGDDEDISVHVTGATTAWSIGFLTPELARSILARGGS